MTKKSGRHLTASTGPGLRWQFAGLSLILLLFVGLSFAHSVIVPLTQGEDELAHFRYIDFIAQNGRLPTNYAERQQAWYRADWPPFYHLIVGGLISPLDTSRPHLKDVGESPHRRLVGEIFYPRLIIYTEDVNWPWHEGILAWHIGRILSIVFATTALLFTYFSAFSFGQRTLDTGGDLPLGASPALLALAVTALLAFIPRFVFTSAMLSDDSLFVLLSAAFIFLLLRALYVTDRWWIYGAMGLLLGLSIVTKYSTGLLVLLFIPLIWWRGQAADWTMLQRLVRLLVSWLFVGIGASWWFGWIGYHFNTIKQDGLVLGLLSPVLASGPDVSMRRVFAFFTGEQFAGSIRPDAVSEGNFIDWLIYTFQTFWGVPVLEKDPLFPWAYAIALIFGLSALIGLYRFWRNAGSETRQALTLLIMVILLLLPFPVLRFFLTYNVLETGQGRHILYPAAQSVPLLLMVAWLQLGQWVGLGKRTVRIMAFGPAVLLLGTVFFQLVYMHRTYPLPLPVRTTTFDAATIAQPLKHNFGDSVRLLGYDFQPDPEQAIISLTLYWKAIAEADENYLVQVQLVDPAGQPRFVWLSHPLDGLYPTRAWDIGDVIRDELRLPLAAVPANTYQIQLNLLHEADLEPVEREPLQFIQFELGQTQPIAQAVPFNDQTEYRLWIEDQPVRHRQTIPLSWANEPDSGTGQTWQLVGPDEATFMPQAAADATAVFIVAGDWPSGDYYLGNGTGQKTAAPVLTVANEVRRFGLLESPVTTVDANFADLIKLLGFTLPERRVLPGDALPLSVAWQSMAPVLPDAMTFAVLLDSEQRPFGSVDRYPSGFYSPMLWASGEIVTDEFALSVAPDAPDGVYTIHLGLYQLVAGQPGYLPLIQDGQPTDQTAVVIGPIKVGGPPPDIVTDNAAPQTPVNQTFGGQITLLGYDLSLDDPDIADFTFYWQADENPGADYTTFLHLRNSASETVSQKDQPPAAGRYPTSLWSPGEIITSHLLLPLDHLAAGAYTPVVGLYQLESGARLPVPGNPANETELKTLVVPR
jgi:4-amino-4-deoxy-L-arabinose transferase-like glycosyltransferase